MSNDFSAMIVALVLVLILVLDRSILTVGSDESTKPGFSLMSTMKIDDDFKPKFNGKLINKNELNLTEAARLTVTEPDYYDAGDGPSEDDGEDEDDDHAVHATSVATADRKPEPTTTPVSVSTTTTTTTTMVSTTLSESTSEVVMSSSPTTTPPPSTTLATTSHTTMATTTVAAPSTTPTEATNQKAKKMFSLANTIKLDKDFKPLFKGRVIPRTELNLTEMAKKVAPEPDYYDSGEGDDDDPSGFGDDDDDDPDYVMKKESVTMATSSSTTVPTNHQLPEQEGGFLADDSEDIDMAVGGITGIIEKIIRGPKDDELAANAKPEDVYVFLSRIINEETSKAFKATIPRIYDYQFPIGNILTQRCFNSFAQFGDRLRKHYIWPIKMVGASASFSLNKFALRQYGDFDSCLNILADDEDRRSNEALYFGQYCMVQVELPLPLVDGRLTIRDQILDFNNTELSGTFSEYFLLNAPFLYSNPLSYSLCLPSTCSPREMESVLDFFLSRMKIKVRFTSDCYSRLNMTVQEMPEELVDMNATTLHRLQRFSVRKFLTRINKTQMFAIFYVTASICLVGLATIYEVYKIYHSKNQWKSTERDRPKSFIACFSIRYNLEQIFAAPRRYARCNSRDPGTTERSKTIQTNCLDAIKTLALAWTCLANFYLLGYQPQMLSSLPHIRDTILSLRTSFFHQFVLQSWLSYEIFFLISGFLLAYTGLPTIASRDGRPSLSKFFTKRLIRFIPSIMFLMLTIQLLPLWRNAGPLYNSGVDSILRHCAKNYWKNFFFVANFYDYDQVCLPYFWYISNEFQLFSLGVFVLVFCYNRKHLANRTFTTLILIGCIMSAYTAYKLNLSLPATVYENAILEEIPAMIKALHFNTIVHFSSYFSGMAIGFHFRMNPNSKPFNYGLITRVILAIIMIVVSSSFAIHIPLIWSLIMDKFNPSWQRIFSTVYFGISRIMFIGSGVWIISQCLPRKNIITKVLSWSIFRICAHISLQIYLLNLIIIWIYLFTKRTLLDTNLMESFPVAFSLFIMTCVVSMFTHLLFEAPYRSLYRYFQESPRIMFQCSDTTSGNRPNHDHHKTSTFSKELDLNGNFVFIPPNILNDTGNTSKETACCDPPPPTIISNHRNHLDDTGTGTESIPNEEKEHPQCYTNPVIIIE